MSYRGGSTTHFVGATEEEVIAGFTTQEVIA